MGPYLGDNDPTPTEGEIETIVFYHNNCDDGTGAALAVMLGYEPRGPVDFRPMNYGDKPGDVEGKDVIIVDFSFDRETTEQMLKTSRRFCMLDHHKTALEALGDLDTSQYITGEDNKAIYLEKNESGASMAWDMFVGGERPMFVQYLRDRDIWLKQLPQGDEFTWGLRSYPRDIQVWMQLWQEHGDDLHNHMILRGQGIAKFIMLQCEEFAQYAERVSIGGFDVPMVNAPHFMASDLGHLLCQSERFAAVYSVGKDGVYVSLRSHDDGEDVSRIAKAYGGGGHRNAAGFKLPVFNTRGMGAFLKNYEAKYVTGNERR